MESLIFPSDKVEPSAPIWVTISAALFLAVCVGTVAIDTAAPLEVKLQGAEALAETKRAEEASFFNGSAAAHLQRGLRKRSRVQSFLGPFVTAAYLRMGRLPESELKRLIVGRDGWLFLAGRCNYDSKVKTRVTTLLPRMVRSIDVVLRRKGHRFILAPIPRKAAVVWERLKGSEGEDELAFDADVLSALEQSQVDMVNVLEPMRDLEPTDAYMKCDSHWDEGGVNLLVDSLSEKFGDLRSDEDYIKPRRIPKESNEADLLQSVRLVSTHPATRLLHELPERVHFGVIPQHAVRAFSDDPSKDDTAGSMAHFGTSFSLTVSLSARLAAEFDRPIVSVMRRGIPSMTSLGGWATTTTGMSSKQPIIFELPMYQAVQLGRQHGASMAGLVNLVRGMNTEGMVVWEGLDKTSTVGELREQPIFPNGTLMTSGDGALYLEVEVDSPSAGMWEVMTGHVKFPVRLPAGKQRFVLPVLEAAGLVGSVTIRPDPALGSEVRATVRVLADAGVPSGPVIALQEQGTTGWETRLDRSAVDRDDYLDIAWAGGEGPTHVRLQGTTSEGKPLELRIGCAATKAHRARVMCTPFTGGELNSVALEVHGARDVTATYAGLGITEK
jgi:hypothetical protein